MYDIYCELRDRKGVSDYAVAKSCGFNQAVFSDWKSGKSVPKLDKLQKIAHYFGVSVSYLIGEESPGYYIDPEAARIAQELFENRELRILFDAARGVKSERLLATAALLEQMKETNPDA